MVALLPLVAHLVVIEPTPTVADDLVAVFDGCRGCDKSRQPQVAP
jgi:hypothetical protein